MKNTKKILAIVLSWVIVLSFVGCSKAAMGNADVDNGLKAFNKIVKAYPENMGFHNELQHWSLHLRQSH